MKKLLLLILITATVNCYAQSPIIDIEKLPSIWDNPQTNAYYKDIHNFLNDFEGTWLATKGNTTLKIVLKKLEMVSNDVPYYMDYIVGGYQFLENGVEKINTLSKINIQYVRSIYGNRLLKSNFKPKCNDCDPNKRRLNLSFIDRERDISGSLFLQHTTVNGQPALKAILWGNGKTYNESNPPANFYLTVPTGEYLLIKQ